MSPRLLSGLLILLLVCVSCVSSEPKRTDKDKARYHYLLGMTSLSEKNPTGALKEFLEAERLDDRDHKIQAGLAQAYWDKKAFELAEKHFLNAIKLSKGDPLYYNNMGALYLTMGRYDDSISAFRAAAENLLFDRPEMAWTGIGFAYVQKGDYPAAYGAYKKATEVNPRFYLASFRLGELYYNQDRPVEALDAFTRVLELSPNFVQGHYWQGLVYMKMKDTAKAKLAFTEVVRLAPGTDTARLASNYLKILQ